MRRRSSIVGGLILILAGLFFLALPLFPNLASFIDIGQQWPLIIVGIGGLFLIGALLGTPPLAIPGSIIAGIGLMIYYQNLNDAWATWAFSWSLIPGFVGVGVIIMNLLEGKARSGLREGGRLVVISLVLFFIFGSLFAGWQFLGTLLAVVLIVLGIWLLARNLRSGSRVGRS